MTLRNIPNSSSSMNLPGSSSRDAEENRDKDKDSPAAPARGRFSGRLWQLLIAIVLIGCLAYVYLDSSSLGVEERQHHLGSADSTAQVTVVMNTFKRHDMMMDAIDYYAKCPVVRYIYVIWSEPAAVPEAVLSRYTSYSTPQVVFHIQTADSLNNRFRPLPPAAHTDAVFSVDDDMRIPCADLSVAHEVWASAPMNMVGFMPRIHVRRGDSYQYRCWWFTWWTGAYSIVLTKAALLHHRYFAMYTSLPQELLTYIDDRRNCEDIAMQFLVSNVTNLAPIYVKGHLTDLGALGGISTSQNVLKAGHMAARDECINDLIGFFGRNPLRKSHFVVDAAANGWTNRPSTWYEFISSDLWKWS